MEMCGPLQFADMHTRGMDFDVGDDSHMLTCDWPASPGIYASHSALPHTPPSAGTRRWMIPLQIPDRPHDMMTDMRGVGQDFSKCCIILGQSVDSSWECGQDTESECVLFEGSIVFHSSEVMKISNRCEHPEEEN
jgi:hypothetical protein